MPLTLAAIPGIIQGVTSIAQLLGGASKKAIRPEYEISDSAKQSLALSQAQAASNYMPGYSQAKTNIDLATANKVKAAGQYGNAQESLAGIMGEEGNMLRNLGAANEQSQKDDLRNYQGSLDQMGALEDQKWKLNKLDPFKDAFSEKRDMVGAGIENIFGAADKFGLMDNLGMFTNKASSGSTSSAPAMGALFSGVTSGIKQKTTGLNIDNIMKTLSFLKNRPS